jgi:RNA polymerase sigma-70 factor (ECF subfamily)
MDAVERADLAAMADLLAEDVRTTMPPYPMWFQGRDSVLAALAASWSRDSPGYVGRFQMVPTRANRQPAAAAYVRRPDDPAYRAFAIAVLRIEDGRIVELTAFHDPGLFPAFALPAAVETAARARTHRCAGGNGHITVMSTEVAHGQGAVLGDHVAGRLHRRPRG